MKRKKDFGVGKDKKIACPHCGLKLPANDLVAQIRHMNEAHPHSSLVTERQREAERLRAYVID